MKKGKEKTNKSDTLRLIFKCSKEKFSNYI